MNLITGDYAKSKGAITAGIRPEHLTLSTESGSWKGRVTVAEHLGADTFLHLDVEGIGQMTARASGGFGAHHGDTVHLTPDESRLHRFDDKG